jgi:hypothetical protein
MTRFVFLLILSGMIWTSTIVPPKLPGEQPFIAWPQSCVYEGGVFAPCPYAYPPAVYPHDVNTDINTIN